MYSVNALSGFVLFKILGLQKVLNFGIKFKHQCCRLCSKHLRLPSSSKNYPNYNVMPKFP